ncbi:SDR family oxidoreductase [Bowmanella dokdonensis]|uniref:SDR family oxidoreductase n=1 Tax=Bowmanella dokdonensis TaxID=751969 RepID=A0A939DT91_9ALTE|nr:SDR family oxidoreductase [Bowmanella dokdonensis]MBN7827755.1 SDR family oxidoreductase [Bowmanella dokdonensis]
MDKVMLITGASSGIGEATARLAAKQGMRLILTARSADKLNSLVNELGRDQTMAVPADATAPEELEQVIKAGIDRFGRLDVAFANAGTGVEHPGVEKGAPQEWRKMIDVNVMALLYTAKYALPHLHQSRGQFILTASAAGRRALKGSVYGASKWFAYGFGQNLAEEMAEWQGRCTTICPGMVNTPFFDEPKPGKLAAEDVADAVLHAINADPRNNVREIFLMPND